MPVAKVIEEGLQITWTADEIDAEVWKIVQRCNGLLVENNIVKHRDVCGHVCSTAPYRFRYPPVCELAPGHKDWHKGRIPDLMDAKLYYWGF